MNIPEGWPTEEMQEVGNRIAATYGVTCAVPVFKAMLSAAPTPPALDMPYEVSPKISEKLRSGRDGFFDKEKFPTPPEVEPIGYVSAGGIKKLHDKYADGQSVFPHRGVIYSEPVYASLADEWADKDQPLPEDAEISASHPLNTDRHDLYQEAQRLVGAKRSKFALIDLVNWLLYKNTADDELRKAAEEAHALLVEIDQQMSLTESACEVMDDLRAALNKGKS